MTGRNYINPNDRGRFGFSESGEFRAPFKGAHIVSALIIAAAITVIAITVVTALALYRQILPSVANGELFLSLIAVFVIAVIAIVCIIVAITSIRALNYGFKCRYTANDEKMVLTIGGDMHTIYYKDVQTVHFLPRSSLGKVNGYDVTVKINGANEHYSITFDGFLSEKNTPFYIIRERAEMLRNAEYDERARLAGMNAVGESSRPIRAEDVAKARERKSDVYDRVTELLGKDAEMPGVSLAKDDRNTARAVRAYRAEQEARAANVPVIPEGIEESYDIAKIREKVSPTVGGYAADMPTLGKDGKVVAPPQMYMGDDGREVPVNDVIGSGTFRVELSKRAAVPLWIAAVILLAIAVFAAIVAISSMTVALLYAIATAGAALVPLAAALTIIKYIRQGTERGYKANGREFVVTAKNKPEEHIYYNEVAGVTYSKRKFLWFDNGYNVEITTNYGVIGYRYVFPQFRNTIKTEDLPFELIRKYAEKQNRNG
ncbi:MAG: hypothetical protein NC299_10815 [Lachnospiraceae bacterium]|nr:hypothetical protein [Ruminococcus sp.]MCM1275839.1 hypothetical protein [Lachnospiraceae bacterium]